MMDIGSFKVTQGHRFLYQLKAHILLYDFLLVHNTNNIITILYLTCCVNK